MPTLRSRAPRNLSLRTLTSLFVRISHASAGSTVSVLSRIRRPLASRKVEVVVSIRRSISYPVGRERAIAMVIAGLKEKYGTSPHQPGARFPTRLVWYYDAVGK